MTYIGCMNQLWRSAMMSPMSACEIALFAYLVNESNKRYWKMPFARQTFITARKHLAELKLIFFIEGKSRHVPSNYSILECTDGQTDSLTHDLTPIKDKDIYQNKVSFKEERCEIFDSKKERENGISKRKENSRSCPVPAEGADYEGAF